MSGRSLKRFCRPVFLIILFSFLVPLSCHGKALRKYPCDPKFGYEGNYLEITTGGTAEARDLLLCFDKDREPERLTDRRWWQTVWQDITGESINEAEKKVEACIRLASVPGRFSKADGQWTGWDKPLHLEREETTYQFALCGSDRDPSVWEEFQKYLGVDSWDGMRIVAEKKSRVMLDALRVVQNRVRILDNESAEEGDVDFLLDALTAGKTEIDLTGRIRKTKLNRINCLNIESGPPYCEEKVPGLGEGDLSPVITAALLELGHSGSKKYRRENNAYCSEFSFYVIEKGAQLSSTCTRMIPNPALEDVNSKDMYRWFKMCGRIVPRAEIRERIKPGDYVSVDNLKHSVTFLGWADQEKKYFWEISGNNRCLPERETDYAPKNKANMVCISRRHFDTDVQKQDFGGAVED